MREGKGFLISCDKYFRMVWEKSKFERKAFVHYPPQKKAVSNSFETTSLKVLEARAIERLREVV
jgi:hypothetical protein